MQTIFRRNYIYIIGFILLIAVSCAIVRTPEGGPKDFMPPKVVSSNPAPNSVRFDKKSVALNFDEYIELRDLQQNFIISPPFKKRVVPKLRNNSRQVYIEFEEDLQPNTTYTLSFGNAIVDLHEGNPLPNYTFAFSTGDVIDSLSLTGRVMDALTQKPEKESMYVMLYRKFNDTIPRKSLPAFVTKTNSKGWFTIPHVYADSFMIFALKDANMNMKFDQPGENIAFSDTSIVLDASYYQVPDSAAKPIVYSDSITLDSIDLYKGKKSQIDLYFFTEEHSRPNFLEYARKQPDQFSLMFELPPDSMSLTLLKHDPAPGTWFISDNTLINDTMSYWITDTSLVSNDSLLVKLSYMALDSLDKPYLKCDTIDMVYKRPTSKVKRAALAQAVPKLSIASSTSTKPEVDLNDHIFLEASMPVQAFDKSKMALYMKDDTLQVPVSFDISRDSVHLRRFNLGFKLDANREYKFIDDTMAFLSIYGQYNDSSAIEFKTRNDDYYGEIKLTLANTQGSIIVQVMDEKGGLVAQKYVNTDGLFVFDYMAPGKYGLKVIYDTNNNKKWDTGNWGLRLQPERTEIYNGEVLVRSNWEVEVRWELGKK